jgi:ABC-type phosphate transport system substrate-binding protein
MILKTIFSIALTLFSVIGFAQDEIVVDGAKFTHSLINKWITEYKKENPDVRIVIKNNVNDAPDLYILAGRTPENANKRLCNIGRYALVPVTNSKNPLLEKAGKGLKKKDLVNLLFEKDIFDETEEMDEEKQEEKYVATVYSRGDKASTTAVLAEHFDQTPEKIKGKKIIGDELYLLSAIQKDETGVTFNTLNYAFDLKSRQLKSDISILPLQLKSKQKEVFNSQNIDKLIALLEETDIETIPVENFGLLIPEKNNGNQKLRDFADWILSHGHAYNHEYGFLSPDSNDPFSNRLSYNSIPNGLR